MMPSCLQPRVPSYLSLPIYTPFRSSSLALCLPIPSLVSISKRIRQSDPLVVPATIVLPSGSSTAAAAKSLEVSPAIFKDSALARSVSMRLTQSPDPPHRRCPEGNGSKKRTCKRQTSSKFEMVQKQLLNAFWLEAEIGGPSASLLNILS